MDGDSRRLCQPLTSTFVRALEPREEALQAEAEGARLVLGRGGGGAVLSPPRAYSAVALQGETQI